MDIKLTTRVYFSPAPAVELDITPQQEPCRRSFDSKELLIIGFPVFAGRFPAIIRKRLAYIKGKDTPAVVIATYGNRHYDDALLEMADFLGEKGFIVTAGAALVTEHSIVRTIAAGRPDPEDMGQLLAFSKSLYLKLADLPEPEALTPVTLPGNHPYKPYKEIPFKPQATMDCVACCLCAQVCPTGAITMDNPAKTNKARCICVACCLCAQVCPTGAITMDNPAKTNKARCISCMACVAACPHGARSLGKMELMLTKQAIGKDAAKAKRMGLTTIQRFLIGDSRAYDTSLRILKSANTDGAEILPAAIAREILPQLRRTTTIPLLAGGFIHTREEIEALCSAGFEGVTSSKKKHW